MAVNIDRIVTLARDLIQIPSTQHRPEERRRALQMCRHHIELVPGVEIHSTECGGFDSLVAVPQGLQRPSILMAGHLDVIDHPEGTVHDSTMEGGRLIGPGAGDMKGQCALLIELFGELHRNYPGLSLGLALTTDEESGGEHGVGHLVNDLGWRCDLALIPDGGSIHELTVEEKGILHLRLVAGGHEGHAARPWLSTNALVCLHAALSRILAHFNALVSDEDSEHWYPTCVPTIMRTTNATINCIPGEAEAWLDVRFPPPHTVHEMIALLRSLAGPDIHAEIIVAAESSHLDPDPLYKQVTEEITGQPVREKRASGGSDARFFAAHGSKVILTRPAVGNLHTPEEWIDLSSLELYYQICEAFILRRLTPSLQPSPVS